jgi:hypothetical protein
LGRARRDYRERVLRRPAVLVFSGQVEGVAGAIAALAAQTLLEEIADRLGGDTVELGTVGHGLQGSVADGVPARPLQPWDAGRADQVASGLAAAVVATEGTLSGPAGRVVDDLSARGVQVEIVALGTGDSDPLVLSDRVHGGEQLRLRSELLRLSEVLPAAGGYVVAHLEHGPPGADVMLESRAHRDGLTVSSPGPESSPLDLAALVAGAAAVVTDGAALASIATAHGRAVGGLTRSWPEPPTPEWRAERRRSAQAFLDELSDRLRAERARVETRTDADLVGELQEWVRVLAEVNAGLRRRLDAERAALVARLRSSGRLSAARPVPGAAEAALVEARAEAGRLRQELDRLYATKTMRAVEPARRIYGRVRSILR